MADTTDFKTSITLPQWLKDRLDQASAENARSVSGEIQVRVAASFGCLPTGEALPLPAGIVAKRRGVAYEH